MLHIWYWKAYHAHWGADTPLGKCLMSAQTQHFKYEGLGVQISTDDYNNLAKQWESMPTDGKFPIFWDLLQSKIILMPSLFMEKMLFAICFIIFL